MDDQNKVPQAENTDPKPTELNSSNDPVMADNQEEVVPPAPVTPPAPPKQKKSKKIWLILLLALLLIGGGIAAWWFVFKDSGTTDTSSNNSSTLTETDTTPDQAVIGLPDTIPYAFGDASGTGAAMYWRLATGGERTESQTLPKGEYVLNGGSQGQKVYVLTDNTSGAQLWYSSDAGKTYKSIFKGTPAATPGGLGEQLTSAVFASDGNSIALAVANDSGNTVKEINLSNSETKDLFTTKDRGVFLYGYDVTKKDVFYSSGCYNCDGSDRSTLLSYDLDTDSESTIYQVEDAVGVSIVMNPSLSKYLVVSGKQNTSEPGIMAPYTIQEVDITSKQPTTLKEFADGSAPTAGYSAGGEPYYSSGNSVYMVKDSTLIFEAGKPVMNVYYLGKDSVILSSGAYDDFALLNYTFENKNLVTVFNGESSTRVFGVTTK